MKVVAPPAQRIVYGEVPPVAVTVTLPVVPAKQDTLVMAFVEAKAAAGWVMVAETFAVHPLASVTTAV